jgi:hypothetical protein
MYCSRLSLSFDKTGIGSAIKIKKYVFHFVLLSPFTIFADILAFFPGLEYKRRNLTANEKHHKHYNFIL